MLLDLFGDLAGLQASRGALMVGISQVPRQDEDGDAVTLDHVRDRLGDTSGLPPPHKALIEVLTNNIFTFDLLSQGDASWLRRAGIIAQLQQIEYIEHTGDIFKTVCTSPPASYPPSHPFNAALWPLPTFSGSPSEPP